MWRRAAGAAILVGIIAIAMISRATCQQRFPAFGCFGGFMINAFIIIPMAKPCESRLPKAIAISNFTPNIDTQATCHETVIGAFRKNMVLRPSHIDAGRYYVAPIKLRFVDGENIGARIFIGPNGDEPHYFAGRKPADVTHGNIGNANATGMFRILFQKGFDAQRVNGDISALENSGILVLFPNGIDRGEPQANCRYRQNAGKDGEFMGVISDPFIRRYGRDYLLGVLIAGAIGIGFFVMLKWLEK